MNFHEFMMKKRHWPRWLPIPESFVTFCLVVSTVLAISFNREFGGTPFACGCLVFGEKTNWALFWSDSVPWAESKWWYGLGHTWRCLFYWPFVIYITARGSLFIGRVATGVIMKRDS